MDARGDQRTALQDFNRAHARGEGAGKAGQAVLDRDDRRTRHVDVAAEGDVSAGVAAGLDSDVQDTRQTRDGIGDSDRVGTGKGQLAAVKEDGSGGAERAGDGFGAVIEIGLDEVTADIQHTGIDAVGAAEGIVTEDVEVRTAVLDEHTGPRNRAVVADITARTHGCFAVDREVAVPAQGAGFIGKQGTVVQANRRTVTGRHLVGRESGTTVNVNRLTTKIADIRIRYISHQASVNLHVARVDGRVNNCNHHLASARLGERVATHVEG